jgi:DNA-binding NarL/FixJ family response regulator
LALSLDLEPDLRCVAVAYTARDGLAKAAAVDFAVAIVDLDLPDADGLDVIGQLRQLRPSARVVVVTAHPRPDLARRAIAAGAVGFLAKGAALAQIITAIRHADADHPVLDAELAADRVALTPREYDVLRQLGQGRDASRAAAELGVSVYTARDHIKSLMAKLDARTSLEAVVSAERLGLIKIGSRY